MEDRSARLAALKARANKAKSASQPSVSPTTSLEQQGENEQEQKRPKLTFRNYVPTNTALESQTTASEESQTQPQHDKGQTSSSSLSSSQPPFSKRPKLQKEDDDQKYDLEYAVKEAKRETTTSTLNASADKSAVLLAPHKINMDLKQHIDKKLSRLEKRTQKAIVQLLKERLEQEAAEEDDDDEEEEEEDLD